MGKWMIPLLSLMVMSVLKTGSGSEVTINFKYKENSQAQGMKDNGEYAKDPYLAVVRRCASFRIDLTLKDYVTNNNKLFFRFVNLMDRNSKLSYPFPVLSSYVPNTMNWWAWGNLSNKTIALSIYIPCNVPIGYYSIQVGRYQVAKNNLQVIDTPYRVIVLFNPLASDDVCFIKDRKLVDEYVHNTNGVVYQGFNKKLWDYGQWNLKALKLVLWILQKAGLNAFQFANPIIISRKTSKIINSNDDAGVLQGKWSEEYDGGKHPNSWSNSLDIFKEYYEKKQPVKYGQCWVFACLATSVFRLIGLPARPITCIKSAHDGDQSLTIDNILNEDDGSTLSGGKDSIWNFHVWTEVFFSRQDMPFTLNNHAWQVVDATPQEKSEGYFQTGPTHKTVIKYGLVDLMYDGAFVYTMVNADEMFWNKKNDNLVKIKVKTDSVGTAFLTKKVGQATVEYEDIIDSYKHKEGSEEERLGMTNAGKAMELPYAYDESALLRAENKSFGLRFVHNNVQDWGSDVVIMYQIFNKKSSVVHVHAILHFTIGDYTGIHQKIIYSVNETIELRSREARDFKYQVPAGQYILDRDKNPSIRVLAFCVLLEMGETVADMSIVHVRKPSLEIQLLDKLPDVSNQYRVNISLQNPLNEYCLTKCRLQPVFGTAVIDSQVGEFSIGARDVFQISPLITIPDFTQEQIIFQVDCDLLREIIGFARSPNV